MRQHGVAVFGRGTARHVPRDTCCRQATPPPRNMTVQSNSPAHTPQHKSTWNHSHTGTLTPTRTPPVARTALHTTFSVGWGPQKRWFEKKKAPRVRKRGVAVSGQARVEPASGWARCPKSRWSAWGAPPKRAAPHSTGGRQALAPCLEAGLESTDHLPRRAPPHPLPGPPQTSATSTWAASQARSGRRHRAAGGSRVWHAAQQWGGGGGQRHQQPHGPASLASSLCGRRTSTSSPVRWGGGGGRTVGQGPPFVGCIEPGKGCGVSFLESNGRFWSTECPRRGRVRRLAQRGVPCVTMKLQSTMYSGPCAEVEVTQHVHRPKGCPCFGLHKVTGASRTQMDSDSRPRQSSGPYHLGAFPHSANHYAVCPGHTPAQHPPTEARVIHSNQKWGCRIFFWLRPR